MPISQDLLSDIRSNEFKKSDLSLNEVELTDEDVIELVRALKFNSYVKKLSLKWNNISSVGAQSLATLSQLEMLDIFENNIGPEGASALARSNLYKLDISANPVGDAIAVFAAMPSLIELDALGCNITDIGAGQLFLSKSIKRLNLQSNKITGKCLENIIFNTVLEDLDLLQNHVQDKYCQYIAQNSTLKILGLTSNGIEDEGAMHLAKSCSLEELNLSQCYIKDEGAIALSQNKILKKLILFRNKVTELGAKAFINNTTLTYLSLDDNSFEPNEVKDLEKYYYKKRDTVFTREEKEMNLKNTTNSIAASTESFNLDFNSALTLYLEVEEAKSKGIEKKEAEELLRQTKYADLFYPTTLETKDFFKK